MANKSITITDSINSKDAVFGFNKEECECRYRSNTLVFTLQTSIKHKTSPLNDFLNLLKHKYIKLESNGDWLEITDTYNNKKYKIYNGDER